jgi:adenine-specific DNA-methyltransferase
MRLALPPISCKVYTPPDLADAIVRALGDNPRASWLEPSHGTGAFIDAIARLGARKERVVAIDLDRTSSVADRLATTFRGVDFLRWANETERRFDRIVGNPPFIAINRLPESLQKSAASVLDSDGRPIGRGANVWYAFVLASLHLLKQGGSLAFILPSAAEFADYSAAIRKTVRETFSSLELYRCKRPLFESVQEGTLVAIARGYKAFPCKVSRKHFETREGLIKGLLESSSRSGHKCPSGATRSAVSMVTLDTVAEIRLGGVTGDASYFLMNEEKRRALELPKSALIPVVSKAKHLQHSSLSQKEWDKLKSSGQRIWLFNPPVHATKHPKVKQYVELADDQGGCNRNAYKVTIREPWYRTPMPKAPDAFLSGMSQHGPWLSINEMEGLNATNTLYVVTFRNRDPKAWYRWALALLSSTAQRQIRRIGRRYADGLIKYEPGALGKIELPALREDVDHKSLYARAVGALLAEDLRMAKDIADSALLNLQPRVSGYRLEIR